MLALLLQFLLDLLRERLSSIKALQLFSEKVVWRHNGRSLGIPYPHVHNHVIGLLVEVTAFINTDSFQFSMVLAFLYDLRLLGMFL
jgi:hypothetical protein